MSDYLKTAQAIIVCEHDDGDDDRNVTVSWRTDDGGTAGWTFDAEVGPGETSRAVDEIHRRIAEAIENAVADALAAERVKKIAKTPVRPRSEYHEDCGLVAWWTDDFLDTHEEPYIGSPLDLGFPESYQWWSELPDFTPMVEAATSALDAAKEQP